MRRAASERPRTLRRWRRHIKLLHSEGPLHCICEFQPGRFRKGQRVAGCGQTHCWLCHHDKYLGVPTRRDVRANLTYREFLAELPGRWLREKQVSHRCYTTA